MRLTYNLYYRLLNRYVFNLPHKSFWVGRHMLPTLITCSFVESLCTRMLAIRRKWDYKWFNKAHVDRSIVTCRIKTTICIHSLFIYNRYPTSKLTEITIWIWRVRAGFVFCNKYNRSLNCSAATWHPTLPPIPNELL